MIPLKDNLSCKIFPIATLVLIALNVIAFGIELMVPADQVEHFFMTWAMVPANMTHAWLSGNPAAIGMSLLTVLTAMFLHGGWSHIIGNMIFLQAFGRAVEGRLGWFKYLLVYIAGGFAAWGLHFFTDPTSMAPALGASGAIAAVLGAYLVFYPKAEFKTLFITPLPILAVVRAYWLLIAWIAMQLFSGVGGLLHPAADGGGVAYWAHIGGFLFGMIVAGVYATLRPQSAICYTPLSCGCECGSKCSKKSKFEIVRFWGGSKPTCGRGDHHHHD